MEALFLGETEDAKGSFR